MAEKTAEVTMDKLVSLCKRRGFVFQSSEIYGGLSSAWDYGPMGVELKKNIQNFWWKEMTQLHENIVGLDAAIMMHPRVWEASGHVANFSDPLVDCKECKNRFRADHIDLSAPCPVCGNSGTFTEPRQFNLMFQTHLGPVKDDKNIVYLRPETAQGIFVNFRNVVQTSRVKIPFGIAQVGKAFRNEIVTKNFIFRTCEFEQMEMQFFVKPGSDDEWFNYWREQRMSYYEKLGIRSDRLRWHQHGSDELAHYAKDAYDIEYLFPMGWQELEGVHNRTDFDLGRHQEFSGKDQTYLEDQTKERYVPYVIETSAGLTRSVLMVLSDAYEEEQLEDGDVRTVMHFHPAVAPITVAILPLVKKDGIAELAREIEAELREDFNVFYDQSGAIGRRYRRQDEGGTPYCVTVDYDSKEDGTVTLRFRDSMEQVRVHRTELAARIRKEIKEYKRV
ncbi:glycine--tRNA ligase [Marispirochaeta aestuarii]|uniref:glycine--tRNA ligase n=1 Tax=Marispirochaeta aestuarii TaxID=1963862 RepID=UPI002ABE9D2A|nr:glycine--tRNA ligase [Marispirochaeta aestuarii]